jgi:hypothetical protein
MQSAPLGPSEVDQAARSCNLRSGCLREVSPEAIPRQHTETDEDTAYEVTAEESDDTEEVTAYEVTDVDDEGNGSPFKVLKVRQSVFTELTKKAMSARRRHLQSSKRARYWKQAGTSTIGKLSARMKDSLKVLALVTAVHVLQMCCYVSFATVPQANESLSCELGRSRISFGELCKYDVCLTTPSGYSETRRCVLCALTVQLFKKRDSGCLTKLMGTMTVSPTKCSTTGTNKSAVPSVFVTLTV